MQKFVLRSALRPNQISFSHGLGHNPTNAPKQTAPLFDHQSVDIARSPASSAGIGSPDPAREITDAAAGIYCGARECSGVAGGGAGAAADDAGGRVSKRLIP